MGRHVDIARQRLIKLDLGLLASIVAVAGIVATSQIVGPGSNSGDALASEVGSSDGAVGTATPLRSGSTGVFQDPAGQPDGLAGEPIRVAIPRIGVDAALERLSRAPDGRIAAPVDFSRAGWYAEGPRPGEVGPAIVAGHVDSATGPAVFLELGTLVAGDLVEVTDDRGQTLVFEVDDTFTAPKGDLPPDRVYGATPDAQLRLVTCDGEFDESTGHYVENLIVSATLVS